MRARVRLLFPALTVVLSLASLGLVLELALRFAPVRSSLRQMPVNAAQPVVRYSPSRTITWSKGWLFDLVNEVRVNNYGYFSAIDYDPDDTSPLLAVVGDSYVEAAMVPWDETLTGRLSARLGARARVYGFGVSGAQLSQYLVFARFARDTFRPRGLVVVVVSNDFDESFRRYGGRPGLHYFEEQAEGGLVLRRSDFEVSLLRRLGRKSALLRYLVSNWRGLCFWPCVGDDQIVGGTWADPDPVRVALSRKAVARFLSQLPVEAALPPSDIVLLVDGIRPQLYDADALAATEDSYIGVMRRFFATTARRMGYEVVDLQPRMIERWQRNGTRFEFATDAHWNGEGHLEAARAVAQSEMFARLFEGSRATSGSSSHVSSCATMPTSATLRPEREMKEPRSRWRCRQSNRPRWRQVASPTTRPALPLLSRSRAIRGAGLPSR